MHVLDFYASYIDLYCGRGQIKLGTMMEFYVRTNNDGDMEFGNPIHTLIAL